MMKDHKKVGGCENGIMYTKYYENRKLHRLDGPAVEYADGYYLWYIEGVIYTEEDFNAWIRLMSNPNEE